MTLKPEQSSITGQNLKILSGKPGAEVLLSETFKNSLGNDWFRQGLEHL